MRTHYEATSSSRVQDALDTVVNEVGIGSGIDKGGTGSPFQLRVARPVWSAPQVHAYVDLVVAVFPTRDQAQAGLNALQQAGFAPAQCGLVTRSGELGESGGLLARRHSADEGPFDALIELGVPGDAARLYQQTFEARQTIVAVRAPERADQAISVLRQVAKMDARQELIDPRPLDRQSADRPVGRPLRPVRRRTARGSSRVRS